MVYNETLIKFVMGYHWQKIPVNEIATASSEAFHQRVSQREVREIISKYTLRHHGEPVERKHWPVACD